MTDTDIRKLNIAIVGAGNVATHLAKAFHNKGFNVIGICSKHSDNAARLASAINSQVLNSPESIPLNTDLVLIATTDTAIKTVVHQIPQITGIVAHTSGSVSLEVIQQCHKHAAVMYPLQTFSQNSELNISNIPFFIEGSDEKTQTIATDIARCLSDNVFFADSHVRAHLHVAGVLTSNFPIWLLEISSRILESVNIPLDAVKPLMQETIQKAFALGPQNALTGPARRGDTAVINKQLQSLQTESDKEIYLAISNAILQKYHPELNEQNTLPS